MTNRCRNDQRASALQELPHVVSRDPCRVEAHRKDVPALSATFHLELDRKLRVLQDILDTSQRVFVTGADLSWNFSPDGRARRWRGWRGGRRWRRGLAASQREDEHANRTTAPHQRTNTSSIALDVVVVAACSWR